MSFSSVYNLFFNGRMEPTCYEIIFISVWVSRNMWVSSFFTPSFKKSIINAVILKSAGIKWVHCVPTVKMALKAQDSGVDAVVAEGTEAGGHNGFDGVTTFCLVPQVVDAVQIPVIAAGGIADHRGFLAALDLGAEGIQVGTRFAATVESSAADAYKQAVVNSNDTGTYLGFSAIGPIRMVRTGFAERLREAELQGISPEELHQLHGSGRGRKGIFEGDGEEGMFEAGQSSGLVNEVKTVKEVMEEFVRGYFKNRNNTGS